MNTQKLLTIIVPTYNMEKYLSRGLDSLIVEKTTMLLIEVLIINDGSTDNSSQIAHQYQEKYPDTFRVIDKENGNYGSCINRGLKEATGKYIKILDADDWFDNLTFKAFLRELTNMPEVDMVLNDYQMVSNEGNIIENCRYSLPYGNCDFQLYEEKEYFALPSITYRTQILKDIKYTQLEGIPYTDNEWMYYPQCFVEKCTYLNYNLYRYFWGRDGQTMSPEKRRKAAPSIIKLLSNMILFAGSVPVHLHENEGYKRLIEFICHTGGGIYNEYLVKTNRKDFRNEELKSFDAFIAKHNQIIYKQIAKKEKLKVIPIHYVTYWRKLGKRFPVDFLRELYRKIRYGNKQS